ncbi:late competence development ComFB family protein [Microseira wollei]|uniref:Late competence development protein ComFB n=1 Tax=Microseira wollei NIES-4236 TaxID=2530354 RepID=A0AAV3XGM6_9CYAN|nr:late competence development ComFB family protein [Microseira wollei]GET42092.1 late competence development protein ComFB [Microseira wollei NIES-4236]
MNAIEPTQVQVCRNVMETLVSQEIDAQLLLLPARVAQSVNKIDVMTYAMNRLPALYASSQKGWQYQMSRAQKQYGQQILLAVRQAIIAVQRDPLRRVIPLQSHGDVQSQAAQVALDKLKELLQNEQLSWSNLVVIVEQSLIKASRGEMNSKSPRFLARSIDMWDRHGYLR